MGNVSLVRARLWLKLAVFCLAFIHALVGEAAPPFEVLKMFPTPNALPQPWAIAVDSRTNIVIAGNQLPGTEAALGQLHFLVKCRSDGTVEWGKPTTSGTIGGAVTTDESGNIYVTGNAGLAGLEGSSLPTGSAFLAKYDTAGTLQWATGGLGPEGYGMGRAIVRDDSGNLYILGQFSFFLHFGDLKLLSNGDRSRGYPSIFLAKYDSSGKFLWAKAVGGKGSAQGSGLALDKSSNTVVFSGTLESDSDGPYPMSFGNETFTVSTRTGFFARASVEGEFLFMHRMPGTSIREPGSLSLDSGGGIYVTGIVNFTGEPTIQIDAAQAPAYSIFTAAYTPNGEQRWLHSSGGNSGGQDYAFGITTDSFGNVYSIGRFVDHATFGTTLLQAVNLAAMPDRNSAVLAA